MGSIQSHVRIVAWLHILLGCLCILGALFASLILGAIGAAIGGGATGHAGVGVLGFLSVGGVVFILIGIFAVPHFLVGWGLLNGAEWARIVGIIISILSLLHPVVGLGTAIAIYSLVILFSSESEQLFRRAG